MEASKAGTSAPGLGTGLGPGMNVTELRIRVQKEKFKPRDELSSANEAEGLGMPPRLILTSSMG